MTFYGETVGRNVEEKVNSQVHRLARHASDALALGTQQSIEDAKRSLDELRETVRAELVKDPSFLVAAFNDKCEQRHLAFDKRLHDRLAADGERHISAKDFSGLRAVIGQMYDNLPQQADANGTDCQV